MYSSKPSFVLGFHGLDQTVGKKVLNGEDMLRPSTNSYDWLGSGVYFWENSPERARQYAEQASQRKNSTIKNPFVIGAVLDLGHCFDLLDKKWLDFLRVAYNDMLESLEKHTLPTNQPFGKSDLELKKRELDCAVIRYALKFAQEDIKFDSVRAVFWEGEALYPGAGFRTHNHIQIAIINPNCIKGLFLPREKIDF
ncbi:hypothetical protein KFZ76_20050 [Methylovulum psychrotolerans]|uniref:hypothetical protein n=1 Tax=Methylovulum psychrotolerans TaxID=1704499 RepID=UPI001BFF0F2A|nr:hypothetical protein [Methylovulum psychrotolerans]MBT9099997.1 hypothetical protein [Methylovulum psychrotolerans]